MEFIETNIKDLFIIKNLSFNDERGFFTKTFNSEKFKENNIDFITKEFFYSISNKNVIRGMHFQTYPYECAKLVFVSSGKILDVVLDIREKSNTYGKYFKIELSYENNTSIFIPKGFAHGFLALEDNSIVNYLQSQIYSSEHDSGIKYDSFGFDWNVKSPIISKKDLILNNFIISA